MQSVLRLAGLLAVAVLSGCGGHKTAEVSGTVTFNGKPLPRGTITFAADDGTVDSSSIYEGAYKVNRAPVGPVKITVTGGSPGNETMGPPGGRKQMAMKMGDKGAPPPAKEKAQPFRVPDKYGKVETTDQTFEVKSGSQQHNVDLTP